MAAGKLAVERGGEPSTRTLDAVCGGSGEYAPGFSCRKIHLSDGLFLDTCIRYLYVRTVAVVVPGVWEDPALVSFEELLLDEVLLV